MQLTPEILNQQLKSVNIALFSCLLLTSICFSFSQCIPIAGHGFVLDKYKCQCRSGFYHSSRVVLNGFKSRFLQYPLVILSRWAQNFDLFKSTLLGFMKNESKKQHASVLFLVLFSWHLVWNSSLWMCVLGPVRLWNLKLQSKDLLTVVIVEMSAMVLFRGGFWITDLLDWGLCTVDRVRMLM